MGGVQICEDLAGDGYFYTLGLLLAIVCCLHEAQKVDGAELMQMYHKHVWKRKGMREACGILCPPL